MDAQINELLDGGVVLGLGRRHPVSKAPLRLLNLEAWAQTSAVHQPWIGAVELLLLLFDEMRPLLGFWPKAQVTRVSAGPRPRAGRARGKATEARGASSAGDGGGAFSCGDRGGRRRWRGLSG